MNEINNGTWFQQNLFLGKKWHLWVRLSNNFRSQCSLLGLRIWGRSCRSSFRQSWGIARFRLGFGLSFLFLGFWKGSWRRSARNDALYHGFWHFFGGEEILFWTSWCSCLRWLKAKKKSTRPFSRAVLRSCQPCNTIYQCKGFWIHLYLHSWTISAPTAIQPNSSLRPAAIQTYGSATVTLL